MIAVLIMISVLTIVSSTITLSSLVDHNDFIQSGTVYANWVAFFGAVAAVAYVAWKVM